MGAAGSYCRHYISRRTLLFDRDEEDFVGVRTCLCAFALNALVCSFAAASTVTFETPFGAAVDNPDYATALPVSARAVFTTYENRLSVDITNLFIDPMSIIQNISGLGFSIDTGQGSGTVTSSSGMERNVNPDGSMTNWGMASTGWALFLVPDGLKLDVLGTTYAPGRTLIGAPASSRKYESADASIWQDPTHNPFLANTIHFDIAISGLSEYSAVNSTAFFFGITDAVKVNGVEVIPAPEPGSTALIAGGLMLVCLHGFKARQRSRSM
jgi:hypothetical protein